MTVSVFTLFVAETAARILTSGLEIAQALGLPVTSWRTDDPARALLKAVAEALGAREEIAAFFARSGFLSWAEGDWLTLLADELYGVKRIAATQATSSVTLSNAGGGWYDLEPGDFRVRSSTSGVTYTSTEALSLHGVGATQTIEVAADVDGSDGSAAANEIDALETVLLGVSVTASTAATGNDQQSDESLREQCRATLGALSPNGPADAYEYVARNTTLTGSTEITRANAVDDATDLTVAVYVAGASGPASESAVTLAQAAVDAWAVPLTVTATVLAASGVEQAVTATVTGTGLPAAEALDTLAEATLGALFAAVPIGGVLARSAILSALQVAIEGAGASRVAIALTEPAADLSLDVNEVVTLGAVSVTRA